MEMNANRAAELESHLEALNFSVFDLRAAPRRGRRTTYIARRLRPEEWPEPHPADDQFRRLRLFV